MVVIINEMIVIQPTNIYLNYRLQYTVVSSFSGDSLRVHNGFRFSTKDKYLDTFSGHCAQMYEGAWYYTTCHNSNLNGLYLRGNHTSYADGIEWALWKGQFYSLKKRQMKIRPTKY